MTQMNLSMKKQKNKIKDTREQIVDCQGGKGWERGGVVQLCISFKSFFSIMALL